MQLFLAVCLTRSGIASSSFLQGRNASNECQLHAHAGGYITLKDGQTLEYDWLVLALGAETASFGIPGVRELALPFCTYNDAVRVRPS